MKNTANDEAASDGGFGPEAGHLAGRIACLAEFMTADRYAVLRRTVAGRTRYMTVLAENMFHGQNAAALVRHCEAFGIQEMHTVESLCPFEPSAAVVRGTDRWVDIRRYRSTDDALAALRGAGYRIVATTPHREDCTPETFDVARGPFALVFGTEHAGISDGIVAAADEFLRIPMCGMVESLNVSASAAILIYMLCAAHGSRVADAPCLAGRGAGALDAPQREGFGGDSAAAFRQRRPLRPSGRGFRAAAAVTVRSAGRP